MDTTESVIGEIESRKLEIQKKKEEVDDGIRRFQVEVSLAKQELEAINRTYPNVLAREFLGYSKAEANKIRRRRKQLMMFIEESPLIQIGFEDEKMRLNRDSLLLDCQKRDLARYQSLKEQLRENPRRTDLENLLLSLSHELGCLPDSQKFLQSLKIGG